MPLQKSLSGKHKMSKDILRIIPTMQSIKLATAVYPKKKPMKPKKMLKEMVSGATKILVGIPLMKETATQVEGF